MLSHTTMFRRLISHRRDPTYGDNEIHSSHRKPNRPLTSIEIERMIAKAEKEAIVSIPV